MILVSILGFSDRPNIVLWSESTLDIALWVQSDIVLWSESTLDIALWLQYRITASSPMSNNK